MKRAKSSSRKSDKSKKEECLITDDESFDSFQTSISIEEKRNYSIFNITKNII
jgi:hypothetical protein